MPSDDVSVAGSSVSGKLSSSLGEPGPAQWIASAAGIAIRNAAKPRLKLRIALPPRDSVVVSIHENGPTRVALERRSRPRHALSSNRAAFRDESEDQAARHERLVDTRDALL